MAIKITVAPLAKFKVKGVIRDETGVDQPFDFSLVCERRTSDEIKALTEDSADQPISDFMASVVKDWDGVKDAENKPIPYSADALRALFQIPGIGALCFRMYFEETGAKAKN